MARIYKRGDIYWIQYYQGGKLQRESLKTGSRAEANELKARKELEIADPAVKSRRRLNPTLEEFWPKYMQWATENKRERSAERSADFWANFVAFLESKRGEGLRLADISRADIEGMLRAGLNKKLPGQKKAWSKSTANNALKDVRAIFNWAIALGEYTGENPTDAIEKFKVAKRQVPHHTKVEADRLLKIAKARDERLVKDGNLAWRLEWVVLLGCWAGLRRNELCASRWEWFTRRLTSLHEERIRG